jgi:hypothetical protein
MNWPRHYLAGPDLQSLWKFPPPTDLCHVGPGWDGLAKTASGHRHILRLDKPISSGVSLSLDQNVPATPFPAKCLRRKKTIVAQCLEGERCTRPSEESRLRPLIGHGMWLCDIRDPPRIRVWRLVARRSTRETGIPRSWHRTAHPHGLSSLCRYLWYDCPHVRPRTKNLHATGELGYRAFGIRDSGDAPSCGAATPHPPPLWMVGTLWNTRLEGNGSD